MPFNVTVSIQAPCDVPATLASEILRRIMLRCDGPFTVESVRVRMTGVDTSEDSVRIGEIRVDGTHLGAAPET